MATEAELVSQIHSIANGIRARGPDAVETRAEHNASLALKIQLLALRNPPPPPRPLPTVEQLRQVALATKLRVGDLTLAETNEFLRLGAGI